MFGPFRLGNSIKMTEQLTWEQGIGYVLSGAPDEFMMASVPDAAGISVTTGVKYDWNKHLSTYYLLIIPGGHGISDIQTLENRKAPGELNASLFLLVLGSVINSKKENSLLQRKSRGRLPRLFLYF